MSIYKKSRAIAASTIPSTHTVTFALRGHGCLIDLSFMMFAFR